MTEYKVSYDYDKDFATGKKHYYAVFRKVGQRGIRIGYAILKTATRALEYGQAVLMRYEKLKEAETKNV